MKTTLLAVGILSIISFAPASAQQPTSLPKGSYRQTPEAPHIPLPVKHVSRPEVLHWCSQHCSTWVWTGNRYVSQGTPHPDLSPKCGMTVERFDAQGVIMHRTDCGQFPGKATLTGKVSDDGESITDGKIEWTYHPCCGLATGKFVAAWGDHISTVPKNDTELAALKGSASPSLTLAQAQRQSIESLALLGILLGVITSGSDSAGNTPSGPAYGCAVQAGLDPSQCNAEMRRQDEERRQQKQWENEPPPQ